jgi:hypothetical protein
MTVNEIPDSNDVTATEQFDTAHHIIIVATQRLHKAQSSCYGLQSTMVAILAFKYWMFRVRLVGFSLTDTPTMQN